MPEPDGGDAVRDEPVSWPVVSSVDLHRDDWVLALRADTVHAPDEPGTTFRRLVVELPGAAMILAVDEEERAVLVQQYRHPAQARLLEVPAGLLDQPGEDPLVCAQRELREEVALGAERWEHLLTVRPSPGMSTETHAIFLATGLHPVDRGFVLEHEEAEMSVLRVPVDDLLDAVLDGRVQDAPLVTAVLAYDVRRRRGGRVAGQPES
ncbi:NUDIX hydrolase [Marmoricola endophyticus]|uniref:NUDIX hydrolase n=1 Tax=Marmoricola endophyticus TaxID=2040280 RepID=A0A917EYW4_9ACTN|nr:NUDIX hydrolase [Marmoricola endophyticus]GGF35330.1 NUDIX hydrolase [Marmoricola endophyticus]